MTSPGEREMFKLERTYYEKVDGALADIFANATPHFDKDGTAMRVRGWRANGYLFAATETKSPPRRKLFGIIPILRGFDITIVQVLRIVDMPGNQVDRRIYHYTDEALQVTNTIQLSNEQGPQARDYINEWAQGVHTPSSEEYADFLSDTLAFDTANTFEL